MFVVGDRTYIEITGYSKKKLLKIFLQRIFNFILLDYISSSERLLQRSEETISPRQK